MTTKTVRWLVAATIIVAYTALGAGAVRGGTRGGTRGNVSAQNPADTAKNAALVDYDADAMQNRGDGITRLIGNVRFHHNGAIIQCDSAFQYTDERMEFFGQVIIEKDSALIYGDRVLYNGATNLADVFAPIVKMVQGEAVMYSYNLQFDTKNSIGYFHSGGVMTQGQNLMEAQRGYFEAQRNYIRLLDSVALQSEQYVIKTDSLGFDMDAQRIDFLTLTYIWDQDRDFLRAGGGNYFSSTSSYLFTDSAYMMTPNNELWADTIRYLTAQKQAFMFGDVQLLDTINRTVAFGEWGYFDDSIDRAVLTDRASIRVWEFDSLGMADSSYMRADTILLLTLVDSTAMVESESFEARDIAALGANSATATAQDTAIITPISDTTFIAPPPPPIEEEQQEEPHRVIRAYKSVRSWNPSHQSRCDSTVVYSQDSTLSMFGNPVLWSQNNQISAEQIDMYTTNGELDWCNFTGDPFIAQQIFQDDTVYFNQAEGRQMEAYFKDNELDYTILSGNVKNIYYMQDAGKLSAFVSIESSELRMEFEDRYPTKMTWRGSGEGPIHPIDRIPPTVSKRLPGFVWLDSLRPKSAVEISPQAQKPSLRTRFEAMPQPAFNINTTMQQHQKLYTEEGRWRDRNDWPSVTSDYFLQRRDQLLY